MRVGKAHIYERLVPPHIVPPPHQISTSATRGRPEPIVRFQRLRCRFGLHPAGDVWDTVDFTTGRCSTRCDACGKRWEA